MTPYGPITVYRNVYQTTLGGKTYIPADRSAKLLKKTTPRMGKMMQWLYAKQSSEGVCQDFKMLHGVDLTRSEVQNISDLMLDFLSENELKTTYELPKELEKEVDHISVSRDGVYVNIAEEGYKEAMAGTISFYNKKGERLHTIYTASSPEQGKESFNCILSHEIEVVQEKFPDKPFIGVSDGASDNWTFLGEYTNLLLIDFFHVAGYLNMFADAVFKDSGHYWFELQKTVLKAKPDGVFEVIKEMEGILKTGQKGIDIESAQKALTYFKNKSDKMNYYEYAKKGYPIGSGVVEAACKTLVQQRTKLSGMKWKRNGLNAVLAARALVLTEGRWEQFWNAYMRYN